jgi:four helix bundle protein
MNKVIRHNYKNLKIWNLGLEIANDISDLLQVFPKYEKYDLSSQMSRCSVSIPSNIAEGSAKSNKQFSSFIDISIGSTYELETQLLIAFHRKYINQEQLKSYQEKIEEFLKMTMSFQNTIKRKITINNLFISWVVLIMLIFIAIV